MAVRSYKDLIAWQKAMELAATVYQLTANFPKAEMYCLTSQIRRAAVSIPSNLAEGQGRGATIDFVRYTRIALGSLQELETQIILAGRLGYAAAPALDHVIACIAEVGKLTRGLQKSLGQAKRPASDSINNQLPTIN
jgi:four helix bundle protein